MSQDTEREDFEARWPTPSGVAWIDAADGYGAVSDRALGLMAQQARWEGWQARAALASQQAVKGEPKPKRLGVEDVAHILSLAERYASTCKTAVHQRYGHRPMLTVDGCKAHVVAARKALEEALLEFVDARPPDR